MLRLVVSAGVLFFIFTRPDLSFRKVIATVRGIDLNFLYLAICTFGLVFFLGCLRWKVLLEAHGIRLRLLRIVKLFFIGLFFSSFLPSLTGGDIIKAYYVSKETTKRAEAVMTIIVDRVSGLLALFLLGAGAGVLNLGHHEMRAPVLGILAMFSLLLLFLLLAFNSKISGRFSSPTSNTAGQSRLKHVTRRLYQALYFYKSRPRALTLAFILSLMLQSLAIVINYQIGLGLGMEGVSIGYFFLFIPLAAAISAIPVSVAGWGVGEAAYKKCFNYVGVGGQISVSISFLLRLMMLAWSLIGLPLYLSHKPQTEKRK